MISKSHYLKFWQNVTYYAVSIVCLGILHKLCIFQTLQIYIYAKSNNVWHDRYDDMIKIVGDHMLSQIVSDYDSDSLHNGGMYVPYSL